MALVGQMLAVQLGQSSLQVAVRCLFLLPGKRSIKLMAHAVPDYYSGRYQKILWYFLWKWLALSAGRLYRLGELYKQSFLVSQ